MESYAYICCKIKLKYNVKNSILRKFKPLCSYQKKKPSGQAEAIVKESIDSDKLIHAENRGNQNVEEQSNRGSPGVAQQSTTCS